MKLLKENKKEQLQTLDVGETKTAILEIKTGINENCALYDPFGLCTVNDCFQCDNCAYRISFDNGKIVETYDFKSYPLTSKNDEYFLEFITPVGKDIYGYLTDDSNDYRITRINDNITLRLTKEDQIKEYGTVSENSNEKVDQANRKRLVLIKK